MPVTNIFATQNGPIPLAQLDQNFNDLSASAAGKGVALLGYVASATGAVATDQYTVNEDNISVFRFMTAAQIADVKAGTLSMDVTVPIQVAIDYYKTMVSKQANGIGVTIPYFVKKSGLVFPPGLYKTTAPLWFGDNTASVNNVTSVVEYVYGAGAVIVGSTTGAPVIDMSGSFGTRWEGLTIFGSATNSPNVGILLSRVGTAVNNESAGAHRFTNVNVHGDFTLACIYNYASEINFWGSCYFFQNSGLSVYYATNNNARRAVTSLHAIIDTSVQSAYADFFNLCIFKSSTANATANGAVFYLESQDFGPSVMNCYIDSSGTVYMPNFWFRNAQGLTSLNTTAIGQGCRIIGNTFEYRASNDIMVVDTDHYEYDLTFKDNSSQVDVGYAQLRVANTAKVKNAYIQPTAGDTLGLGTSIITVGSGEVSGQALQFIPTRAPAGTDWDYIESSLIRDGAYHAISLTSVFGYPTSAKYALVKVLGRTTAAADGNSIHLRGSSATANGSHLELSSAVSNISMITEGLVPIVSGSIEYLAPANYALARFCIRGYYA